MSTDQVKTHPQMGGGPMSKDQLKLKNPPTARGGGGTMSTENPPTAGGPMSKDQVKNPSTALGGGGAMFTENPPRTPLQWGDNVYRSGQGKIIISSHSGREGVYKFGHTRCKRWNSKIKSHVIL